MDHRVNDALRAAIADVESAISALEHERDVRQAIEGLCRAGARLRVVVPVAAAGRDVADVESDRA